MKTVSKGKLKNEVSNPWLDDELRILKEVQSEFVVSLKYAFENSIGMYLVLEYLENGDLMTYIREK